MLVRSVFFFHAATTLFYITQRITVPKFWIFPKSITIYHFVALLQVAILSSHLTNLFVGHVGIKIVGNKKYDFRADPNDITSIPNFIQIRLAVLESNRSDRQKWSALFVFISCTSCKEHKISVSFLISGCLVMVRKAVVGCCFWVELST
jgi:hypothetical protein